MMRPKFRPHCSRCRFVGVLYDGDKRREVWIHPMDADLSANSRIIIMPPGGDYQNARLNQIDKSSSRTNIVRGMNLAASRGMLPDEEKERWSR